MTNFKRVIAMVLAFMMIFSSVSVLASASDASADGKTLAATVQIVKNDGTDWVECDKVTAGDAVKARVSLDTDYYTNGGSLIFFYDNAFFGDSYASGLQSLSINSAYATAADFADSQFTKTASGIINQLVSAGDITSDYVDTHNYFVVDLADGFTNHTYDGTSWLFEFDLSVLSTATGSGSFFILDSTLQSTTNQNGYIDVAKGTADGDSSENVSMYLWYDASTWAGCSDTVTTDSVITLDPNGGTWADDSTSAVRTFNGQTGAEFTAPALTNTGKTLVGWYDTSISDPTLADVVAAPTAYSEDEDIALTAYWVDQVAAVFSYNYEGSPANVVDTTATPGYAVGIDLNGNSIVPEIPDREGYEFRGWSTDANASAQSADLLQNFDGMVYGSEGVTYFMIWAKEVTAKFVDTKASATLAELTGYAGDTITSEIPAAPTYEGYTNVNGEGNYEPAAPTVYPANDTTYNAVYEANAYPVTYTIYAAQGSSTVAYTTSVNVAFDSAIPTKVRYTAPTGKTLSGWYTDADCTSALAAGTTLTSTSGANVYAYLTSETYTVTFYNDDGSVLQATQVEFGGAITAPATNPTKDGYVFKGWTPDVTDSSILDVAADKNYYPTWELDQDLKEYFYNEDGSAYETIPNVQGETFDVPADPYKYGYSFDGWSATEGSATLATLPTTMPDESTYYYAVFSANDYDVTFVVDGVSSTVASTFDSDINLPADPEKEGFTFAGWAATADATTGSKDLGKLTVETDEENPLTYYAVWTVNEYVLTVNYVISDGKATAPEAYTANVVYNTAYSVASPAVEGYVPDTATVEGTMPADAVTVTVTYTPNKYDLTVTYVMDDGSAAPAAYTAKVDFNADYSVTSPDVTGYTPDNATVTGTMDSTAGKEVTVTYTPNKYTLTVNYSMADGTEAPAAHTEDVAYNASYSVASPDVAGYAADPATVTGTMDSTDGKTVTVIYTPNSYALTVNYVMADGKDDLAPAAYTANVTFNTTYNVTSTAITGYTPDIATVTGTMDDINGKTVTVTYSPNAYTLKITYVMADGSAADSVVTKEVAYNADYSVATPEIEGYTADITAVTGTMDDVKGKTATVTYTPNNYTLTVNYVMADGNTAAAPAAHTETVAYNASYSVASPDVAGYTADKTSVAGTMNSVDGVTVTVTYTPNAHKITWIVNGVKTTEDKNFGETITAPAVTEPTGYTFSNWTPSVAATMPDEDVEYTAVFTANTHNIHFMSEDGARELGTTTVAFDSEISVLSPAPTKDGYDFSGWSETIGGEIVAKTGSLGTLTVDADKTYYANFIAIGQSYKTEHYYMTLDGTYSDTPDDTILTEAKTDEYVTSPAKLKEGFSTIDSTLSERYGYVPAEGTLTLKFYYPRDQYSLTFVSEGVNVVDGVSTYYGAEITAPTVTKAGYTLAGWSTTENGETAPIASTMGTSDLTYYAIWTANTVNITVNETYADLINDGTLTTVPKTFTGTVDTNAYIAEAAGDEAGATYILFSALDAYIGNGNKYTLDKTNAANVLSGTIGADGLTLTVMYVPVSQTVTYNMNGGAEDNFTETYTYCDTVNATTIVPTRKGYTFQGWGMSSSATTATYTSGAQIASKIARDYTLYAVWTIDSHDVKVTYTYSDGSAADTTATESYEYGEAYNIATPEVTGYTADKTSVSGTMDTADVEVTVTYTPNNYTLKVNYVKADGTEIASAYTSLVAYNAAYTVASPEVAGYTPDTATVTGTMDSTAGKTVTVTYTPNKYDLTVNYVMADGKADLAPAAHTEKVDYNASYSVATPDVTGYTADIATVAGTMDSTSGKTVTVTYTPNKYDLTITYVMADGSAADKTVTTSVDYNAAYSVATPEIKGYTADITAVEGTMDSTSGKTATVTYTPINYTITVNYVMGDGKTELAPAQYTSTAAYGTAYSVTTPAVTGYTADKTVVEGTVAGDVTETVTYMPNMHTLTITYVYDEDGTTASATYTQQYAFGASYDVASPEITGYSASPASVTGTMQDADVTAEVRYVAGGHKVTITYTYADGSVADSVAEYTVAYGKAYSFATPEVTGYTADKDAVAGTMGLDDAEATVTYTPNNYTLTINYVMADGSEAPAASVTQVAYKAEYSVLSPVVDGYSPDVTTVTGTMNSTAGVTVTVTYSKDAVTIVFIVPTRISDTSSSDYGKLDYANATTTSAEYAIGADVTAPATDITYYEFLGWTTDAVTETVTTDTSAYTIVTPSATATDAATYYAVYSRELVYLEKYSDSASTVIDRNGKDIGYWETTYGDTTAFPTDGSARWFVTGITPGRLSATTYTTKYVKAHGDGKVAVTKSAGGFGTGTLITVTDNVTGKIVEQFYVVIYGDVDGSGIVNATDLTIVKSEIAGKTSDKWSKRGTYNYYKIKAADLAAASMSRILINNSDATALSNVIGGKATLAQTTGTVTYK